MCSTDIFLGLLALLFPPLPVWVKCGICSADSIINILLCMLGYVPGLIHSWYIIAKFPEPDWDYQGPHDSESGRVFVFVQSDGTQAPRHPHRQPQPKPSHTRNGMSYGTTATATSSSAPTPAPAAVPRSQEPEAPSHVYNDAGEGSSDLPPPSYAQVIAGDNKIQSQD